MNTITNLTNLSNLANLQADIEALELKMIELDSILETELDLIFSSWIVDNNPFCLD